MAMHELKLELKVCRWSIPAVWLFGNLIAKPMIWLEVLFTNADTDAIADKWVRRCKFFVWLSVVKNNG